MKKWLLIIGSILFFGLSGCGESILLNADLDKATVEAYVPVVETVPQDALVQIDETLSKEKYTIAGVDAFYIFPAHRPAPENILDFQVLDFIDTTTTIYAYQAKYAAGDTKGLGGLNESGTASDTDNSIGTPVQTDAAKMETVLMSYNVVTNEYQVFFHEISDVQQTVSPEIDENGISQGSLPERKAETGNFFAQKIDQTETVYFIYLNGVGRVYDKTGRLVYTKDISEQLKINSKMYGGEDAVMTISNVVADRNYFMYVTLNIERKDSQIDENTSEEDLSDEDSGVVQMVFSCFDMNIGEPENPTDEEKSYFVSENKSYGNQKDEWMKADSQIFDLGIMEGEPSKKEIEEKVPSLKKIKEIFPDSYETYHYFDPLFDLKLYYHHPLFAWIYSWYGSKYYSFMHDYKYAELIPCTPSNMTADEIGRFSQKWQGLYRIYSGYIPVSDPDDGKGKLYLFEDRAAPESQQVKQEELERTYTVTWKEEQEVDPEDRDSEDRDSEEKQYIEYSMEIQEKEIFDVQYEIRFRGDIHIQWSDDRYTSDMVSPSPGSGVVYYYTKDAETENAASFVKWEQSYQNFKADNIPGAAQNVFLFLSEDIGIQKQEPVMVVLTTKGIYIIQDFAVYKDGYWQIHSENARGKFLTNYTLDYGLTMGEHGIDELNAIKISQNDEDIPVSSNGNLDAYHTTSFVFQKRNGAMFVYMAGLGNGLIQYNLDTVLDAPGTSGQISPYPYYSIFSKDENTLYGIGFQSTEYAYDQQDLPCAKVYPISLNDAKAASNLVISSLSKNVSVRTHVMQGSQSIWDSMLLHLGLQHADLSQVNMYHGFLMGSQTEYQNAILQFYELAGIPASKRTEETKKEITSCIDPYSLEDVIYKLRNDLHEEARNRVGDSSLEDQSQEVGENAIEDFGIKTEVIKMLQERADVTAQEWDRQIYEILFYLEVPITLSQYKQREAVCMFAEMADIPLKADLDVALEKCDTAQQLEEQMAKYHLDLMTLTQLENFHELTQEKQKKAKQAQQEAISVCKQNYFEKNKSMTEAKWNSQLHDILAAFQEEQE